jgi:uncharacterized membrane protein SpoIIM required for sporulation
MYLRSLFEVAPEKFGLTFYVGAAGALWSLGAVAGILLFEGLPQGHISHGKSLELPGDMVAILANNLLVLLVLASGILTFGFMAAAALLQNGFIFGIAMCSALHHGVQVKELFVVTIFHLIPELAGCWLVGAIGLQGIYVSLELYGGRVPCIGHCLKVGLMGVALTVVAAVVEIELSLKYLAEIYV